MTSPPEPAANPNTSRPAYCPLCGMSIEKTDLKCSNCGWEIQETYNYDCYSHKPNISEDDKQEGFLLRCKNAWLTETEFHYCNETGHILNMAAAFLNAKGLLAIRFNNGKTEQFRLAPFNDNVSNASDFYWGKPGSFEEGIRRFNYNVKIESKEWAAAINMLISKRNRETINCYRCGTANRSTEPQCLHCGATL